MIETGFLTSKLNLKVSRINLYLLRQKQTMNEWKECSFYSNSKEWWKSTENEVVFTKREKKNVLNIIFV